MTHTHRTHEGQTQTCEKQATDTEAGEANEWTQALQPVLGYWGRGEHKPLTHARHGSTLEGVGEGVGEGQGQGLGLGCGAATVTRPRSRQRHGGNSAGQQLGPGGCVGTCGDNKPSPKQKHQIKDIE